MIIFVYREPRIITWLKIFQSETRNEICSKGLVRPIGKVYLRKYTNILSAIHKSGANWTLLVNKWQFWWNASITLGNKQCFVRPLPSFPKVRGIDRDLVDLPTTSQPHFSFYKIWDQFVFVFVCACVCVCVCVCVCGWVIVDVGVGVGVYVGGCECVGV